jgi:site-specific DNA-methyltransferase (adenine-specific)
MARSSSSLIRRIYTGDNLPILRSMDSESADLIYLDPPFNSGKQWANPIRAEGKTAKVSFKDTWDLSDIHADHEYMMRRDCPQAVDLIDAAAAINGESWKAYLIYMGARLLEMRRILKPTGGIYYHCDPVMAHGVKMLMDAIFGANNFRNEIIWAYTGPSSPGLKQFPRKHDTLFWYSKTKVWIFNRDEMRVPYKDRGQTLRRAMDAGRGIGREEVERYRRRGKLIENWWSDIALAVRSPKERTGYPTQKPLALLKRIIKASSNEGDLVLDPFCGCATTCLAAEHLGRAWIGIDLSQEAKKIVLARLKEDVISPLADPEAQVRHIEIRRASDLPKRTDVRRSEDRALLPRLYQMQGGKCAGCGLAFELRNLEKDHIIDRKHGGQDEDINIQLLCGACNREKGDRGMEHLLKKIAARMAREQLDDLRRRRLEDIRRRSETD